MTMFAQRLQEMVAAEGGSDSIASSDTVAFAGAQAPSETAATPAPTASTQSTQTSTQTSGVAGSRGSERDDEVLDVLALAGGMSWAKALPTGGALVSVVAALISVFAAGYASARARSANR